MSGHFCILFVIYWNVITFHHNLLYANNMACPLYLLVLRSDQRQRVNTASLRPVYEELLKLCNENRVVSEVFAQPDAFFVGPVLEKLKLLCT